MRTAVLIAVVAFAFVQLASAQLGPGMHTLEQPRPEGTRKFLVYVPKQYTTAPPGSVQVVFAWHGYTEMCPVFPEETGWKNYSDIHGFISVYPCGWGSVPSFNAGVCCGSNKNDDVEFARLMVVKMQQQFPKINMSRIFTSGFSNGGMMSELLACRMPNTFRAILSVGGTMTVNPGGNQGMANCDDFYAKANITRHVAVLKVHATLDVIVPYKGTSNWPDVTVDLRRWGQRVKCVGNPVQTWKTATFHNLIFQNCPGGPVELATWDGGFHWWPGGWGVNTTGFVTADYAWKFFSSLK